MANHLWCHNIRPDLSPGSPNAICTPCPRIPRRRIWKSVNILICAFFCDSKIYNNQHSSGKFHLLASLFSSFDTFSNFRLPSQCVRLLGGGCNCTLSPLLVGSVPLYPGQNTATTSHQLANRSFQIHNEHSSSLSDDSNRID